MNPQGGAAQGRPSPNAGIDVSKQHLDVCWESTQERLSNDVGGWSELIAKLRAARVDLVVVEGFKSEPHRKIEVHRLANGKPILFPDDPAIAGIATDTELKTTLPVVHLDDFKAIAAMMRKLAISVEDVLAAV